MQNEIELRCPSLDEFRKIIRACNMPQYKDAPDDDERWDWLIQYAKTSSCLVGKHSFCIFDSHIKDPHAPGVGLCCYVTVSNDKSQSRELFKRLVRLARQLKQDWIGLGKRLGPYTYRNQYYLLRK